MDTTIITTLYSSVTKLSNDMHCNKNLEYSAQYFLVVGSFTEIKTSSAYWGFETNQNLVFHMLVTV